MHNRCYRQDIDGLRAIAVLSVFLHHLDSAFIPGGFVGVDVFFVISGYLITSQISEEIRGGTFSIRQFYQRRINRIIPALVTVVSASMVTGLILLSPADLVLLTKSAVYSIFGVSNLFFWREYGNYFAANSAEAPLLHTWSLGVEEQFYVIWPILLLLMFKVARRYAIALLLLLVFTAFLVSEAGTRIAASAAYYLLPTRFFELMIGGLLALLSKRYPPRNTTQSSIAVVFGLVLVVGSLFWTDKATPFPGIWALWPCLGTALLIWSGLRPCALHRILTLRPMVFIGLVSYSLYLWHWPFIAFLKYLGIEIDLYVGVAVMGAALLLSWLSWSFVETPLRRSGTKMPFLAVLARRFALPAFILVALNVTVVQGRGFPARFSPEVARLEASQQSKPNELRAGCHVPTALSDTPPLDRCRLGAPKAQPDGILLGDSFANHFTGMLDVIAKHDGLALMDYTMDGCPPIAGYNTGKIAAYAQRCLLRNDAAYAQLEQHRYQHIILASNWPDSPEVAPLLIRSIERALATGANVTIILKNEGIEDASTCAIRNAMYARHTECRRAPRGQPAYFKELRIRFPSVRFIDPNLVICHDQECSPVLDGMLIYRDSAHLNDIGSRLLGERLLSAGVGLINATSQIRN
ncbi:MAG: acyltransferase [Simplicispira suum]|uniref:acyltransferase family protein n=1 Tax=Simplicispira suum TaxID=2109915 RepID=UPI001C6C7684|nr:acyltransferase family protein [Simplicispira suum]MBW7832185.1 acyltransferase [Simplicispira suum]